MKKIVYSEMEKKSWYNMISTNHLELIASFNVIALDNFGIRKPISDKKKMEIIDDFKKLSFSQSVMVPDEPFGYQVVVVMALLEKERSTLCIE